MKIKLNQENLIAENEEYLIMYIQQLLGGEGCAVVLFKLCLQGTSTALVHRHAVCHSLIFCEDISHKILTTCKTVL